MIPLWCANLVDKQKIDAANFDQILFARTQAAEPEFVVEDFQQIRLSNVTMFWNID